MGCARQKRARNYSGFGKGADPAPGEYLLERCNFTINLVCQLFRTSASINSSEHLRLVPVMTNVRLLKLMCAIPFSRGYLGVVAEVVELKFISRIFTARRRLKSCALGGVRCRWSANSLGS
jgi:hypothetical protein